MDQTAARPRTIQSVARALGILDLLGAEADGLRLGELARRLGVPPQTARSLLVTLAVGEWVVQDGPGQAYRLGPAAPALARRWRENRDLAARARGPVRRLADELGEYVVLAELRGRSLVGLLEVRPQRDLAVWSDLHAADRLHAMATGKVLLAFLDDVERGRVLSGMRLRRCGPRTVTDRRRLHRQLAQIRRRRYAVCREEAGEGIAAVAVPVHETGGRVAAALGAAMPLVRFGAPRPARVLSALRAAAGTIERFWGQESPPA